MQLAKRAEPSDTVIPLVAALSYSVVLDKDESATEASAYDPTTQTTVYAGGRNFSTSREEDSAGSWLSTKNDTKKDD